MTATRPRVRIVGGGRAGRSFAAALSERDWTVTGVLGRDDDLRPAALGVDLLLVATPDDVVADVARLIEPVPDTVVAHVAGSLGLEVLAPHPRRGSVHPLVSLPDADVGASRLLDGAWFATAGDPMAEEVVRALGGRQVVVPDGRRASYHAAACIASNHLVALLGQVERVAQDAGVPFEAYLDLVCTTVDNVAALGAKAALTGPAARGDTSTIQRHLAALAPAERPVYEAMAAEASRLAGEGR